ncbi:MAG: DUF4276 family protein [Verrucomicrobia bacterium]|nr:DUF4276 family protein [Verrucomicrobiota bacterium]
MKVYPIVEGHGEVAAAPVLLRRLLAEAACQHIGVGRPIRRTQSQLRSKDGIQSGVRLALLQPECAAVVILFDGEDDCPKERGLQVRGWAREVAGGTPCDVVIAYREYETWFLAALESLGGQYGIAHEVVGPADPESKRDAKGALEEFMPAHRAYSEMGDQPAMSAVFDLGLAHRRNRSFRKLVKTMGDLLRQLRQPLPDWPPAEWRSHQRQS